MHPARSHVRPAISPARTGIIPALMIAVTGIDIEADEDCPGFRGQDRQGVGSAAQAPLRSSASEHVRWKTPIQGTGHSSPVVAATLAFQLVAENDIREPVVATLAPMDGDFYICGQHHLFRVSP